MSSRSKKKKQRKAIQENNYIALKGFYGSVIFTLEDIQNDFKNLSDDDFFKKYGVAKYGKLAQYLIV